MEKSAESFPINSELLKLREKIILKKKSESLNNLSYYSNQSETRSISTIQKLSKKPKANSLMTMYEHLEEKKTNTFENLKKGICSRHSKPLELICEDHKVKLKSLNHKKRVCTDCAIFGDHKGHSIISCEQALEMESEMLTRILGNAITLSGELSELEDKSGPSIFKINLLNKSNAKKIELIDKIENHFQVTKFHLKSLEFKKVGRYS